MHKNTYKPDNLISKAKIHTHWKNKTTKRKNNSQVIIDMWQRTFLAYLNNTDRRKINLKTSYKSDSLQRLRNTM